MRAIHLAQLDKLRPVVILTRDTVLPFLQRVTVAPITSTRKGLSTEVTVGTLNGLDHSSVIDCDNISTISSDEVGVHLGFLLDSQELELTAAIHAAFDLD